MYYIIVRLSGANMVRLNVQYMPRESLNCVCVCVCCSAARELHAPCSDHSAGDGLPGGGSCSSGSGPGATRSPSRAQRTGQRSSCQSLSDELVFFIIVSVCVCVLVLTAASCRACGTEGNPRWTRDPQNHLQQPGAALSAGRRGPGNTHTHTHKHTRHIACKLSESFLNLASSNLTGWLYVTVWNYCTGSYLSTETGVCLQSTV